MADNKIGAEDRNRRVADEILSGEKSVTPQSVESDKELASFLADMLLEDERRRQQEELSTLDVAEGVEFSAEFEQKMQDLFRKKHTPITFRRLLVKARPFVASAAAILIFCSLILFSFLNSSSLNTLLERGSNIPSAIDGPVTVILSGDKWNAELISLYSDGYYVDSTDGLSGIDDLFGREEAISELPLYRNPIPRPFGSTADIGLGSPELRSYALKLADMISGSPETTPTLLDTEQTSLYLKMTFEGYTLRASRYGYVDLIPEEPQLYSTEQSDVKTAVDKFLDDYPIIRSLVSDETLTLAKGSGKDEYTVYFASDDTVRNAINRDLHEVCVTLQDGNIVSCRIKITDFLLEDMEMMEAITLEAAKDRLLTDERFEVGSAEDVAAADLVYLSGADFEFFYPAYRFYVALSAEEAKEAGYEDAVSDGHTVYRLIQIPAVELLYPNI